MKRVDNFLPFIVLSAKFEGAGVELYHSETRRAEFRKFDNKANYTRPHNCEL